MRMARVKYFRSTAIKERDHMCSCKVQRHLESICLWRPISLIKAELGKIATGSQSNLLAILQRNLTSMKVSAHEQLLSTRF